MAEDTGEVVIGQKSKDLQDFEHGANQYQKTVGNSNLNPKTSIFQRARNWLAGGAAVGAIVGAGVVGYEKANQNPSWFGQKVDPNESSLNIELIKTTNSQEQTHEPVLREGAPTDQAKEVTVQELKEQGIDIDPNNAKGYLVKGQSYAENPFTGGGSIQENGQNHGEWIQFYVGDKPTNIFAAKNQLTVKDEPVQASEGNASQNSNPSSTS